MCLLKAAAGLVVPAQPKPYEEILDLFGLSSRPRTICEGRLRKALSRQRGQKVMQFNDQRKVRVAGAQWEWRINEIEVVGGSRAQKGLVNHDTEFRFYHMDGGTWGTAFKQRYDMTCFAFLLP